MALSLLREEQRLKCSRRSEKDAWIIHSDQLHICDSRNVIRATELRITIYMTEYGTYDKMENCIQNFTRKTRRKED
jgi:hypothetical protein